MWRKRCLVIAPALGFVMASLLLSCGGGTSNPPPVPTATPVTLIAVRMCSEIPAPSTAPCPQPTPAKVKVGSKLSFTAQGQFSSNGVITYEDITSAANWFSSNSIVTAEGSGFFLAGPMPGCACVTAASGSLISQPELIKVIEPSATPTATPCPPCPGA